MSGLKTGDKVKVTIEGEVGCVSQGRVRVNDDAYRNWGWVEAEKVEKIEPPKPEPKFKVGDRVRVVNTTRYNLDPAKHGRDVGTVKRIFDSTALEVMRDGDSSPGFGWYYETGDVELAPDQTFKLRPGDKIRNTKTGRVGLVLDDREVYDLSLTYLAAALTKVPAAAVEEYEEHHPGTYEIIEREGQPF